MKCLESRRDRQKKSKNEIETINAGTLLIYLTHQKLFVYEFRYQWKNFILTSLLVYDIKNKWAFMTAINLG